MQRVAVAMSGGVDSAAAALLLAKQGYTPEGFTFLLTGQDEAAVADAAAVCKSLGIAHHSLDFRAVFSNKVVEPFVEGYLNGITPNPCIFCNRWVKFGQFFEEAMALGFDYIATGHYARVVQMQSGYALCRAKNLEKDQSYVLYQLTQRELARVLLPLGEWADSKAALRALLEREGISVAQRPDSQDICFIPDGNHAAFIESRRTVAPGTFVAEDGRVLGKHNGFHRYTIGQRKGLGVSVGVPAFVTRIEPASGQVVLSTDETQLLRKELQCGALTFCQEGLPESITCRVKLRYAQQPVGCQLLWQRDLGKGRVVLDTAQRALTPGQAAVFYQEDRVLGGGTILQDVKE